MEKTTQIKVRLDDDLVEWLHQYAEQDQRSLSYTVNRAVQQWRRKLEGDRKRHERNSLKVATVVEPRRTRAA